jgi:hypothetical protein
MALDIEEINRIVSKFVYKRKNWESMKAKTRYNNIEKKFEKVTPYPEYWNGYNYSAMMYEAILPHARADVFPERVLSVRAPNQTKEQSEYIRANYKPNTLNVFEDFRATISRAFADQNWSVKYNPEKDIRFEDETFQRYVNKGIRLFGSLEQFSKTLLPTLKLTDPNGIIAIKPDYIESEVVDEEVKLTNNLVDPMPYYYPCINIVGYESDEYYLVISDDESYVTVGNSKKEEGIILELFDDTYIYRISQVGKKSDLTFGEPVVYFQHDLGYVPCIKLMGTPQIINNELLFQSPFITSVPLLDQVINDESYLSLTKATSAFPFMVALGEICEFVDSSGGSCSNGQIFDQINGGYRTCPSCNGAGLKSRFSPSGMLLIKPKSSLSEGDSGLTGDYVKFVSPSMDTLKFLREEIDSNLKKSREILHIPSSDQAATAGESVTATGSLNKMRALYAFLKPISDQLFTIYEFMLITIGEMRYGEYFGGVTLVYPTTFDISTPSDYLSIIAEGVKAGVPPAVTYSNVYNYIKAINYTDDESSAIFELIMNADDLLLMNSADIIARIGLGMIEKWQDVLHQSAPQLIMQLIREFEPTADYENFLDQPMQEQIIQLNQLASNKVYETLDPIEVANNKMIEMVNGITATDTPDVASTALNGAQVQSLNDILNSVATGVYPKDTGKAVIKAAFPTLTDEQINNIIDPVQPGSVNASEIPA